MAAVAAIALIASGAGEALAQVTLRIEPVVVTFPAAGGQASFDVYIDNVPSPGLGAFQVDLTANQPGAGNCLTFVSATPSAALAAAWNNAGNFFVSVVDRDLNWTGTSPTGFRAPPGTVLLGTITYNVALSTQCTVGTQSSFEWFSTSKFGTSQTSDTAFGATLDAAWVIGALADRDLTISCFRLPGATDDPNSFDPASFVDGQQIVLDCQVTNLGTASSGVTTTVISVFSVDETVDSADTTTIAVNTAFPIVGAGATVNFTLSGSPAFSVVGPRNLCTKIDVVANNLDALAGRILETDENNNLVCMPITVLEPLRDLVVDPSSVVLTPSALDPNGQFRAGLNIGVAYDIVNQGNGAVRVAHVNSIRIGTSLAAALANPNSIICNAPMSGPPPTLGLPLPGGARFRQDIGLQSSAIPIECPIPFGLAAGTYSLVIQLDRLNNVSEKDPNGVAAPAEANNTHEAIVTVLPPLPAQFRIQDVPLDPNSPINNNDTHVDIEAPPGTKEAAVMVASANDLSGYSLRLTWSPASRISIASPATDVTYSTFLETGGRAQTCAPAVVDNVAGTVDLSCTTTGNPATTAGAQTSGTEELVRIRFTAVEPELVGGTLTFPTANLSAVDENGQSLAGLRVQNGTFTVTGPPDLSIINPVPPSSVVPGLPFSTSWDIRNDGFGPANPPVRTLLRMSEDAVSDPNDIDDVIACSFNETSALAPKSTVTRTVNNCILSQDFRPGVYSGFYEFDPAQDPNSGAVALISVLPRILGLAKSGNGRTVATFTEPDMPGGSASPLIGSARKYSPRSVTVVRSTARSRNWMIGMLGSGENRKAEVRSLPKTPDEKLLVLTKVRLPREDKTILGSADIDADGEDELIFLQKDKAGNMLDFRRVDYVQRKPEICQTAADTDPATNPLPAGVIAATGIDYDADPNTPDHVAVLTDDGALTIYQITLTGALPPASPCNPLPTLIEIPADADLLAVASDPAFGSAGDEALTICALDAKVDGVEDLASIHEDAAGIQSLRIYEPPSSLGGTAVLIADDPAFAGGQGEARMLALGCTR